VPRLARGTRAPPAGARRQAHAARRRPQQRLAQVDQELVEWRDLRKALDKGGLPDLEIDAAGPTHHRDHERAAADQLLQHALHVELVTQVQKADGSGMKDEFTVRRSSTTRRRRRLARHRAALGRREGRRAGSADVRDRALRQRAVADADPHALARRDRRRARSGQRRRLRPDAAQGALELGRFHHVFFISHNRRRPPRWRTRRSASAAAQAVIVQPPFAEVA
jgi:hypothetical protein